MEGKRLGKYRILRELGRGGMGVVYEAEHDQVRHRVAIKVLDPLLARNPAQAARVRVEGIAANLPRHPGIVQVLESDHCDGTPYIVMEMVSGESLRESMSKCGGRIESQRVVRLAKQLADAFAAAHDVGIVHRDAYDFSKVCFHVGHLGPQRRRYKPCPLTASATARSALTSH
ncbi:MAG: serine/threonine protein kinase [Myxococcales bacterium]|nr:serine/threonine protein kinase [Myxococcales bacterium]